MIFLKVKRVRRYLVQTLSFLCISLIVTESHKGSGWANASEWPCIARMRVTVDRVLLRKNLIFVNMLEFNNFIFISLLINGKQKIDAVCNFRASVILYTIFKRL